MEWAQIGNKFSISKGFQIYFQSSYILHFWGLIFISKTGLQRITFWEKIDETFITN